tara:strand:+ start:982 stop:3174 length:2193 start_codon:yes stop_codon:yes gene_type:complete
MAIQDQGIASITPSIGAAGITSTSPTLQSVVPKQTIDQTVDYLKKVPFEYLRSEMTNPTGDIPIYLVAAETSRRLNETKRAQMPVPPTSTVADKLLEESGIMSPVAQRAPMPSEMPMQFSNGGEVFAPVYGEGMGFGRPEDEFGNTSALANTLTSQDFRRLIEDVARERGLTLEQAADLVAMGTQESNLNPYSPVGGAGEIGGMQVKPSTAVDPGSDQYFTAFGDESELAAYTNWQREFAETQGRNPKYGEKVEWIGSNMPRTATMLENPRNNVDTATAYYQGLLSRYDGDRDKAIAAYNQGYGAIDKIIQEAQITGRPFLEVLEEANPEGYAYLTSVNKNLSARPEATVDFPEGPSLEEAVEEKEKVDRKRELELEQEKIREKERKEQEERDRERRYTPDEIIIGGEPPKKDDPEPKAEPKVETTVIPKDALTGLAPSFARNTDLIERRIRGGALSQGLDAELFEADNQSETLYSEVGKIYKQYTDSMEKGSDLTREQAKDQLTKNLKDAGLDDLYSDLRKRLDKRGLKQEERNEFLRALPFFNAALVAIEGGDPGILQTFARVGKAGLESYGEIEQLISKEQDALDEMELAYEQAMIAQNQFKYTEVNRLLAESEAKHKEALTTRFEMMYKLTDQKLQQSLAEANLVSDAARDAADKEFRLERDIKEAILEGEMEPMFLQEEARAELKTTQPNANTETSAYKLALEDTRRRLIRQKVLETYRINPFEN